MNLTRSSAAAAAAAFLAFAGCGGGPTYNSAGAPVSMTPLGGNAAGSTSLRGGDRGGPYVRQDLVSDGFLPADHLDANLVNGWGIAHLPTSPWWVSNNGTATSTLYDGAGIAQPLVVTVTGAGGAAAAPTGVVANPGAGFIVTSGGGSGPARFIFASEDGTISGWNPGVPPPVAPATRSTVTTVMVTSPSGAKYKGLAIASTASGDRLYATDFHNGRVDVFDGTFSPVVMPGAFVDPRLPAGYAPFGIQEANGTIYVTFAKQDDEASDEVAGRHLGFVSAFGTDGTFLRRIASGGKLNAPWGLALAPDTGFGRASGKLLVGNFGDGHVIAYRLAGRGHSDDHGDGEDGHGGDRGDGDGAYLTGRHGPIAIDGLWGIGFGNGASAGAVNTLYFAAGPDDEAHGLFGRIDFVPGHDDGVDDD
jgi:uncharacterized protein (TIGR03118 family)